MLAALSLFKLRSVVKPRFAGGAPRGTPLQSHLSPTFGVMLIAGLREPHVRRWRKERLAPRARLERAVEDGIALTAPRKTTRDIKRHKASSYSPASSRLRTRR